MESFYGKFSFYLVIIYSKLLNTMGDKVIKLRHLNYKRKPLNVWKCNENLRLAIDASKKLGVIMIGLTPSVIREGNKTQILGLLW